MINRFAGKCSCGVTVLPGEGIVKKGTERAWDTFCAACAGTTTAAPTPTMVDLTEEQQVAVDLFNEGVNLAIVAGAGCLAGDTILHVNRAGRGHRSRIDWVVGQVAGTPIPTLIARAEGDVCRLAPMASAWASGVKETIELRTDTRSIRATTMHPFLTAEDEWARLGDLRVGDGVRVNVGRSRRGRGPNYRYRDTRYHPHQVCSSFTRDRWRVPEHRLVVEADMNGMSLEAFLHILREDPLSGAASLVYLDPSLHVHHEDHDRLNNALGNLVVTAEQDHLRHHSVLGGGDNVLWQVGTETIRSLIIHGEEPTYDVEVADAPHNFLANGFVVHNTGKSTTLEAIGRATSRRGQYLAFNSAIVRDASLRMPPNVACSTSHSLAYRTVGKRFAHRLDAPRVRSSDIAKFLAIDPFYFSGSAGEHKVLQPGKLASMVMVALQRFANSADAVPSGRHLPYLTGLDVPGPNGERTYTVHDALSAALAPAITRAWNDILRTDGQLRFTHDFYRKIWQLNDPIIPADLVLLDEAQDCAPVLADVIFKQDSQVIVVGDPQQEIYQWAGTVDAMAGFPAEWRTPLTWSFRFGEAIAEIANLILDQIPGSEIRLVGKGGPSTVAPLSAPKAILARTNGGAVMAVLQAQEAGRSAHLVGGGGDVLSFATAAKALKEGQLVSHPELMCFETWGEVQAYVEQDALGVELAMMVKLIERYGVEQVISAVCNPVSESRADVVVSTAHKAKGRQWESVQLWDDFPETIESTPDWRLLYVASTRAKRVLDPSRCVAIQGLLHG